MRGRKKIVKDESTGYVSNDTQTAEMFNPLADRKVLIKPIRRKDAWLPETHEANFLYKDAYFEIGAPIDPITGNIVQPLTEQEVSFFEDISLSHIHGLSYHKGDLSPNRKEDNVWWTHSGEFYLKLKNEVKTLDLRNAKHYILWRMLLSNKELIAPDGKTGTPGELGHKSTFKFKMENEGFEDDVRASKADKIKLAYIQYGKMEDNRDSMVTLLSLLFPEKTYRYETKMESLKADVSKAIDDNIDKFLDISTDELFNTKSFLYKAIRFGFVVKESNKIYTAGGDYILGRTITNAASYLADPQNQGVYIEISDKIRATE